MNPSRGMNVLFLTLLGCGLTFIFFFGIANPYFIVRIQLHCFKLNCRSVSDGSRGNSLKLFVGKRVMNINREDKAVLALDHISAT